MNDAAKSAQSMPAVLEKLSALDRWITQRFEETKSVEARIEAKLDQLGKVESSLQNMMDGLRRQLSETMPVVQEANEARLHAAAAAADARSTIDDALAAAQQSAKNISHESLDRVDALLQERIAAGLKSVSHEQVVAMNREVQQSLEDESTRAREQAEQTLILFRQRLAERLEQVRNEANAATRPYTNRLSEARDHVDREIEAIIENANVTIVARLEQLAMSTRSTTELLEMECVNRVRQIRPQVMTEVEATQRTITHRVRGLIEQSQQMVDRLVGELDERLDTLNPKAEEMREQLDRKMQGFLSDLQTSADTMLGWLEDRVTGRVDDLVERSRRSMFAELKQLDDASQTLTRREAAASATPAAPVVEPFIASAVDSRNPLSLTMYLDRMKQATLDPKPAA